MNTKLLICGVIATGLLLTACVKKETPAEEEKVKVEQPTPKSVEPKFETLPAVVEPEPVSAVENEHTQAAPKPAPTPKKVEVIREQTANTTTEIRREVQAVTRTEPTVKPTEPKPAAPRIETPKVTPTNNSTTSQSQDDAVAAAIAAAMPALDN